MDTAQWPPHQIAGLPRTMEEIPAQNHPTSSTNNNPANSRTPMVERRARPQKDQNLNCPRCNSTNTKFCYYNNYSLTQPRYFCKTCRRYWTQGGSLRNVPVGGGSRKNKRSSTSSALASSSSSITTSTPKLIPDLNPPNSFSHLLATPPNPKFLEAQDLNLAFPIQGIFQPLEHQLPKIEASNNNNENHEPTIDMNSNIPSSATCTTTSNSTHLSALELLRTGIASRRSLNSYIPMPMPPDSNTLFPSSAFPNLQEIKPNLSGFTSQGDHHHHGNDNNMMGSEANAGGGARLLFPFADMNKLASSTAAQHHEIENQSKGGNNHHDQDHDHHHHNHHQEGPTGYWSGMLGGGTW